MTASPAVTVLGLFAYEGKQYGPLLNVKKTILYPPGFTFAREVFLYGPRDSISHFSVLEYFPRSVL
jgi:hypothetical protein